MADPTFAVARRMAERVEVCNVAVTENATLFQRERRIVQKRVGQLLSERRHFANGGLQLKGYGATAGRAAFSRGIRRARRARPTKLNPVNEFAKLTLQRGDLLQRGFQRDKVTRVPRGLAQSSGGALGIPDRL